MTGENHKSTKKKFKIDMEWGSFPMPQKLLRVLANMNVSNTHKAILHCIISRTIGFHDKNSDRGNSLECRKTQAKIKRSYFEEYCGRAGPKISTAIKELLGWNVIHRTGKRPYSYSININVDEWDESVFCKKFRVRLQDMGKHLDSSAINEKSKKETYKSYQSLTFTPKDENRYGASNESNIKGYQRVTLKVTNQSPSTSRLKENTKRKHLKKPKDKDKTKDISLRGKNRQSSLRSSTIESASTSGGFSTFDEENFHNDNNISHGHIAPQIQRVSKPDGEALLKGGALDSELESSATYTRLHRLCKITQIPFSKNDNNKTRYALDLLDKIFFADFKIEQEFDATLDFLEKYQDNFILKKTLVSLEAFEKNAFCLKLLANNDELRDKPEEWTPILEEEFR